MKQNCISLLPSLYCDFEVTGSVSKNLILFFFFCYNRFVVFSLPLSDANQDLWELL